VQVRLNWGEERVYSPMVLVSSKPILAFAQMENDFCKLAISDTLVPHEHKYQADQNRTRRRHPHGVGAIDFPAATEKYRTLSRPVCWTHHSSSRPLEMAEVVSVVPTIRRQSERFASCLTLFLRRTASARLFLRLGQALAMPRTRISLLLWTCDLSLHSMTR